MNHFRHLSRRYAGPLLLGAIHALSFAPGPLPSWSLPFVQIFSLAFLAFYVFKAATLRQAAAIGYLFGLANFALGFYWLYTSMHDYGGMAAWLAGAAVLLLATAEALFVVAAAALARWLSARHLHVHSGYGWQLLIAAVWASSWTLAEWLRGTLFTGFPWLNVGYAHVEGVLAGWAPLLGVYGLAWFAAFASAAIALLACAKDSSNDARAAVGVGCAIVVGLLGIALGHVAWSRAQGEPLIIRLVQGNVPQSEKFDPQLMERGLATYMQLAALAPKEAGGAPQLIVLPETVVPLFQDRIAPQVWQQWLDIARERDARILMGAPLHDRHQGRDRYTNSAISFDAQTPLADLIAGDPGMRYDKHHLVPFGEFVPPGFRWFVDAMHIPLGDFDRGPLRQALFPIAGQMISPDICYEDVFGEEIIQSVRGSADLGPGATILVNMSNLAWFGDSWALRQHLQISRMRAIETARPMIRATNTGMTAAIDPNGAVRAVLAPAGRGVLDVEVQGMAGFTPYVRWGNGPILAWACLILLLGLALRGRRPAPQAARGGA
ncbi:MAG: apolipoprotein N-acyltransferase [Pollutimonas bauzanensis]|uniref:Apolipoprotein N-acyltransferase n=1 Tax=Pollutimonas bauzanensis TaxID=658167 RepID=A0A1M5YUF5_9BURK|nr:apolipoprotein N-acyltransferase [Pollutimonas bauzanensis]SHI15478.1 Apolipoprotein N-acyltransferase [Pollutimonas bauzanensis]